MFGGKGGREVGGGKGGGVMGDEGDPPNSLGLCS